MERRPFIVGTAGHIDHGKSTLVEALTGTNPDRLPEEQKRGVTIELGFAHLEIKDPEDESLVYDCGLIDVPGHADFVKNMVGGVGALDLALFVVAADDGWMPQTEEHLQILGYLGVGKAIVVVTKADLIGSADDEELLRLDLMENLEGSAFEGAPVVFTSALGGEGLEELRATVAGVLRGLPGRGEGDKPRLHVDRVFVPRGVGTVVTGTLMGGELRKGQEVVVQPGGWEARARALQSHKDERDVVPPGTRLAINLPEVARATEGRHDGLRRGDTVTLPGLGRPSRAADVWLERSPRAKGMKGVGGQDVVTGRRVWFHHGSGGVEARLYLLGTRSLGVGEACLAELRFRSPVYVFGGDRFVVRDFGRQATLGGGLVLDPAAQPRRFRKQWQREFLEVRQQNPSDVKTWAATQLRRDRSPVAKGFLAQSRFSVGEIRGALRELGVEERAGYLVDPGWWGERVAAGMELVRDFHRRVPEEAGLKLTVLRAKLGRGLGEERLFDELLGSLVARGFVRGAGRIRDGAHLPELPPRLKVVADKLLAELDAGKWAPPGVAALVGDETAEKALRFLLDTGEAVRLDDKAVLLAGHYRSLCDEICRFVGAAGRATASEIREHVGTNRRILMPLLERLDAEGRTVRDGDWRTVGGSGG